MTDTNVHGLMAPLIDVYPVGFVRDMRLAWRAVLVNGDWQTARNRLRWVARRESWGRRSYWNGWLAEHRDHGLAARGWTPGLALRHLRQKLETRDPGEGADQ